MIDPSEIGGDDPNKSYRFPDFQKSAQEKMAEALGTSRFDSMIDRISRGDGRSAAERAMAEALGSRIGEYRSATDRMHDLFGRSVSDELTQAINGRSATSHAERSIYELEQEMRQQWTTPPRLPDPPPNPIHKTNRHLQDVAETMDQLLAVQAKQSEKIEALLDVQAKQADMIDALLKAFIASTAAQDQAGRRNLTVAIISAVVGLAALGVALV